VYLEQHCRNDFVIFFGQKICQNARGLQLHLRIYIRSYSYVTPLGFRNSVLEVWVICSSASDDQGFSAACLADSFGSLIYSRRYRDTPVSIGYQLYPITTLTTKKTKLTKRIVNIKGAINRNHRSKGTLAILNIAISPPRVGLIRLVTPSPI